MDALASMRCALSWGTRTSTSETTATTRRTTPCSLARAGESTADLPSALQLHLLEIHGEHRRLHAAGQLQHQSRPLTRRPSSSSHSDLPLHLHAAVFCEWFEPPFASFARRMGSLRNHELPKRR